MPQRTARQRPTDGAKRCRGGRLDDARRMAQDDAAADDSTTPDGWRKTMPQRTTRRRPTDGARRCHSGLLDDARRMAQDDAATGARGGEQGGRNKREEQKDITETRLFLKYRYNMKTV